MTQGGTLYNLTRRRRRALATTETELSAIAALASASFVHHEAFASAQGVKQTAFDAFLPVFAENLVANAGLIAAQAVAHGTSSHTILPENKATDADAIATGVYQRINTGFHDASNVVRNGAGAHIFANATASFGISLGSS